jgi:peptidoglycan/LPS O-acetylase OafA/YrhL
LGIVAIAIRLRKEACQADAGRAGCVPWLAFAGSLPLFVGLGRWALGHPAIPYNVRELLGEQPYVSLTLSWLAIVLCSAAPSLAATLWSAKPGLFSAVLLPGTALLGTTVFLLLSAAVPLESLDDIVGYPTLDIGPKLERCLRFVGLFAGPLACISLGLRCFSGRWDQASIPGLIAVTVTVAISYAVVVPYAGTVNIVELLPAQGRSIRVLALACWFILLGVVGRGLAFPVRKSASAWAWTLAFFIASFPVGWMCLKYGTNPVLAKYGQEFSALQFLLSPNRDNYVVGQRLLWRFVSLQAALTILLTFAAALANDVLLRLRTGRPAGREATGRPDTHAPTATGGLATSTAQKPQPTIAGLDGLRAVACLWVFGVHLQQITGLHGHWGAFDLERFLANGNTGVALFFVLSGFLLSLPFWSLRPSDGSGPSLAGYTIRRVVRILPVYYLCLTALVWHQRHWQSPDDRWDVLLHYLLVHNYRERSFYSISEPFWTIGVQAQFYLLLPLICLPTCRLIVSHRARLGMLLALAGTCYALHWLVMEHGDAWAAAAAMPGLVADHPTVFSHSVLAHLPHFVLGIAAGCFFHTLPRDPSSASPRLKLLSEACVWLAALAIFATLATGLDDRLSWQHGRYNFPYIPALLGLTIVCVPFSRVAKALLQWGPVRWLGTVSFGVYVYHLPCLRLVASQLNEAGQAAHEAWMLVGVLGLAASALVASGSYLLLERPLLRRFRRHRAHD